MVMLHEQRFAQAKPTATARLPKTPFRPGRYLALMAWGLTCAFAGASIVHNVYQPDLVVPNYFEITEKGEKTLLEKEDDLGISTVIESNQEAQARRLRERETRLKSQGKTE
eukprot:TRINITY_DN2168_c0_g1_i1.p1 TRINITY_DN2168_c0_g1~~TRINITY_DN2168_c0_g1_i1.p1  ORF type:complete len:111 (-),score=8.62 TRINITY_DN2168_c0_g1_i1:74-406(-)